MTQLPRLPRQCLLIFARYPTPGQAKTRLIPALGAEGAVQVYRQLAEHTVAQARVLQTLDSAQVHQPTTEISLWYTGAEASAMGDWLGDGLTYQPQPPGDLGDRLTQAFQWAFDQGHRAVMVVGTDCPSLDANLLRQGFQALETAPLVLGPASDGGYYLIGLRQPQPTLFQNITWSTAAVLSQTLEQAQRLGLTPAYLPTLTDIDTPEDLDAWQRTQTPPRL